MSILKKIFVGDWLCKVASSINTTYYYYGINKIKTHFMEGISIILLISNLLYFQVTRLDRKLVC